MINAYPAPAAFPAGICSQVRWLALQHGAWGPRARSRRMCPLAMPLAMVLLRVASVAVGMFLGSLLFHPLLNIVAVRAGTDPPVPDMEDDRRQVAVPIRSLDATRVHSVQQPPGDVMGNRSAAAGGDGKYGCGGAKSSPGSQGEESESRLLHSCLSPAQAAPQARL